MIAQLTFIELFTHAELMFANNCLGGLKYEATTAAIMLAGVTISFVPEYIGARIFLWRVSKHGQGSPGSPIPNDANEKAARSSEAVVGHHLIHSADAQEQPPALQKLKVNIMEAGIIFHSLCKSCEVSEQKPRLTENSNWSYSGRRW